MEKRKLTIRKDSTGENDKKNKEQYTFIIPNSNIQDINIYYDQKKKKEKKEK